MEFFELMKNYDLEWHNEGGWNEESARRYQETGDIRIRNEILERNQRLVKRIASRYSRRTESLEFKDLVNEGNLGFMRALDKFEYGKAKVITYAAWWIRQYINRALANKDRMVRLPVRKEGLLRELTNARNDYEKAYGEEPSYERLSEITDVDPRKIRETFQLGEDAFSLDHPVNGDENITLGRSLADEISTSQYEKVEDRMLYDEAFEKFSDLEKDVLIRTFGLGREKMTLRAAGEELGKSPEGIRQIQMRALIKGRRTLEGDSR